MQGEGLKKLQSGQPISTREQLLLIAQLSWPAILAQISSVVMQYIDTAMVGQLGSNASAAIGVVATTSWLFGDLCIALTIGFNVAVAQALGGNDVFHCTYHAGALQSYAAVPIMSRANPIGCVYVMDFDAEQGEIIENLERNILRGSWILLGGMVLCSAVFSVVSSKRMRKILLSMRLVRELSLIHI